MSALGERFRAAREARGLTLSEVSERLHIRAVYLAAIEDEHWETIGAPVYVRGFLRSYARFLGIDPEEAVAEFTATQAAGRSSSRASAQAAPDTSVGGSVSSRLSAAPLEEVEEARERSRLGPLLWLSGAVAVILVALVVYNYLTFPAETAAVATPSPLPAMTAPASAAPTGSPVPGAVAATGASATALPSATEVASPVPSPGPSGSPGAQPLPSGSPLPPGAGSLTVQVTDRSWVRVVVDGNVRMEGTFPAGTTRSFAGRIALVWVGNAAGVQLAVNGRSLGPLGGPGDVVRRTLTL
jgi:cytoskeleton protein RodZ